jgi:FeS assembly SUF system regulator
MLRVSREVDLGIVLMVRMATLEPGEVTTARELAEGSSLTLPMTSKVLKGLCRNGLLLSHLGARGGYSLAREPERISVADILVALEGPIALTNCIESSPRDCDQENVCQIKGNWQLINRRVQDTLAAISLAEMAGTLGHAPRPAAVFPLRRGSVG